MQIKKKPLKRRQQSASVAPRPKRPFTGFKLNVRSRHPSHSPLKKAGIKLPFRSIVRFGSEHVMADTDQLAARGIRRVECNTVDAVRNSANKLRMKRCFSGGSVRSAAWAPLNGTITFRTDGQKSLMQIAPPAGTDGAGVTLSFPVVTKSHMGSRGRGNTLIQTREEYEAWARGKNLSNYIVEQFHDYTREYRLHVTKDGCFYTNRKMLKEETPENKRWVRNDSTCVWIVEENPQFDKPVNWSSIVAECVKALRAVGLDVGACDVKIQGTTDKKNRRRENPEFIVIEINSAPSFGEGTLKKYLVEVPRILKAKKAGV